MRKSLALLLIALIISMPVVAAQTLEVQQFAGQDGVQNVARMTDTLHVQVLAGVPGDAVVTAGQLRFTTSEGITYLFSDCTPAAEGLYTCTMDYQLAGEGGQDTYTISLHDDAQDEVLNSVQTLTNDFVAPDMLAFSASPTILGAGTTTLTYEAKDYAFAPGDTEACAGVGSIKVYENGIQTPPTATIAGGAACELSGTVAYAPRGTGNISLCAVAFDRLGKASEKKCTEIIVDKSPPVFSGFRIFDQDGFTLHAIPPDGLLANVEVSVFDEALNVQSIRADLGTLANDPAKNDLAPHELGIPPRRQVIWRDVPINRVSPCEFTVRAKDVLDNAGSQRFTCSLVQDSTPPVVLGIETGYTSPDGTPLLGVQGALRVRFQEAGGMERANAYLDTSALGLGGQRKAESCGRDGGEWKCVWHLPGTVAANRYSVAVLANSADDLGNEIGNPAPFTIDFDPEPPVIVSGPSIQVFHQAVDYGEKVVKGDTVTLSWNVTGATTAVGNFGAIGGFNDSAGVCSSNGICSFSEEVIRSGRYTAPLKLTFLDNAGNKAETTYNLEVYSVLNETNPNYWTSTVTCSPDVLDRTSTALVNHQVYCHVSLHSQDPQAEVVATALGDAGECTGDLENGVADLSLINNGFLSKDPYLRVLLATREFPEATFNLTCPVYILTKVGDGFTSFPEKENVTVQVAFGDSPLGSLPGSLDDKINDAVDDAEKLGKWMDTAVKFLQFGEKVCTIRNMLWDISAVWELIHVTLTALEKAPIAGALVTGVRAATCTSKSAYTGTLGGIDKSILAPFCGFINCKGFAGLGGFTTGEGANEQSAVNPDLGFITDWTGGQTTAGEKAAPTSIIDVKKSIVWSTLTLCVPGIIYNIDKYRQIQCRYATCLKRDVKQGGVPVSVCDDEKAYLTCTYVWGQIFQAIPFANLVEYGINLVKEWLSNPFAALALAVSILCPSLCASGDANTACSVAKIFDIIGRVIEDVVAISENKDFFKLGSGPCNELKDLEDEE